MRDLRRPAPTDAHADHVDAHRRPAAVLRREPQPGEPPQPAHLVGTHGLGHATELVAGAGLDLNEHHDACRVVGGDHVQLAVSAPPIARQYAQTKRRKMVNGQLLTEYADVGTGIRRHGATIRADTASGPTRTRPYPQSSIHPQTPRAR